MQFNYKLKKCQIGAFFAVNQCSWGEKSMTGAAISSEITNVQQGNDVSRVYCRSCGSLLPRSGIALVDHQRLPNWVRSLFSELKPNEQHILTYHPQLVIWQQFFPRLDYLPLKCCNCNGPVTSNE